MPSEPLFGVQLEVRFGGNWRRPRDTLQRSKGILLGTYGQVEMKHNRKAA